MANPDQTHLKSELRATLRKRLRGQIATSDSACQALHEWLTAHPDIHTAATYSALPGEVDLSATIQLHPEIHWVYPKVSGNDLTFHSGEILTPGEFGILEPPSDAPEVPISEIDLFLCPGLAFDKSGGRLGRGRGFYDRALADARPQASKLGICHAFQLVPDTFSEAHDIRMDAVLC